MISQVEKFLKTRLEQITVNSIRVRVFDQTLEGQQFASAYPAISYNALAPRFDLARTLYQETISSTQSDGSLKKRKHPEPWILPYQVQIWANDRVSLNQMQEGLMNVLPPRGVLKITDELGVVRYVNAFFDSAAVLDALDMRMEGARELRRVYTYLIESWCELNKSGILTPIISENAEIGMELI